MNQLRLNAIRTRAAADLAARGLRPAGVQDARTTQRSADKAAAGWRANLAATGDLARVEVVPFEGMFLVVFGDPQ